MEDKKYQQIKPDGMFGVDVKRKLVYDTPCRMHYEYDYSVEARPTSNDFINLFTGILCKYGKQPIKTYAALMGVSGQQLTVTIQTLTGASVREWGDHYAQTLAEALLKGTDWKAYQISHRAGFTSDSSFSHYFRQKYKCTPNKWRVL